MLTQCAHNQHYMQSHAHIQEENIHTHLLSLARARARARTRACTPRHARTYIACTHAFICCTHAYILHACSGATRTHFYQRTHATTTHARVIFFATQRCTDAYLRYNQCYALATPSAMPTHTSALLIITELTFTNN